MKRILVALALAALVAAGITGSLAPRASSATAATRADVVIKHAFFGCHSWAANGNRSTIDQKVVIPAGGMITLTNHDNAPHLLVQTSGPTDAWVGDAASGATTSGWVDSYGSPLAVKLALPGTYVFTTIEGNHERGSARTPAGLDAGSAASFLNRGLTVEQKAAFDPVLVEDHALTLTVIVLPTID